MARAAFACILLGLLAAAVNARSLKDCGGAVPGAKMLQSMPDMAPGSMAAMPMAAKPAPSLTSSLAAAPPAQFSTLLAAVKAAGLAEALSDPKLAFTIFAPTNDAFAALIKALKTTPEKLLANKALLTKVLSYHVVPSVVFSKDLKATQKVPTLLKGQSLTVTMAKGSPAVVTVTGATNSAKVIAADVPAGKSVVHVINAVLVPASK